MTQKLIITFCIALYLLGVPLWQFNETHIFDPNWTSHLRMHESWLLLTNTAVGLFCLWWLWIRKEVILSALFSMIVTGSFLLAFSMQGLDGGSIKYMEAGDKTLFDLNAVAVSFGLAFLFLLCSIIVETIQSLNFDMDAYSLPSSALQDLM
jgi:hypothetical protein